MHSFRMNNFSKKVLGVYKKTTKSLPEQVAMGQAISKTFRTQKHNGNFF